MSSTTSASLPATTGPVVLTGTPVVPGVALGPVIRPSGAVRLPEGDAAEVPEGERPAEKERFVAAAEIVAGRLADRAAAATGVSAEVLSTTAGLARDRGLLSAVEQRIDAGAPAAVATVAAAQQFVDMFTALGGLMAERVTDVRDVRDRIVAELTGQGEPGVPSPDVPSVLLADDLAPADTAGLDPTRVIGLATRLGGTTSHTAIIARQLGLPCVVAVGGLDDVPAGVTVLLDGEQGTVTVDPDAAEAQAAGRRRADRGRGARRVRGPGHARATGTPSRCWPTCRTAPARGPPSPRTPRGSGLFRTELSFLGHGEEPSVDGAGGWLRRGLRRLRRAQGRAAHPRRRLRQAAGLRDPARRGQPGAGRPRPPHRPPGPRPARAAARRRRARPRGETDSTPWVMAPMVATVDEAADVRRARSARAASSPA